MVTGNGGTAGAAPGRAGGERLRVLFIEDRPADAELAEVELRRGGLDVTVDVVATRSDLEAGLRARAYDVILSDYNLDGWTGMDALDAIRSLGVDTPCLLVTGSIGDAAAVECLKHGVADYVTKDRLARLPMAVRQALEQYRLRRREAEAAERLRRSEAEHRSLIEHAPLGIFRVTPEGQPLTANPALLRMVGYGSAEELPRPDVLSGLFADPEERQRLRTQLQTSEAAAFETRWKRRDGTIITVRVNVRMVRGAGEAVEFYEGMVEDVSEQRLLEAQFRQAQRLEAVGRLAGGVAHDFNNILTAITGYSDLLLDDLAPDDPKRPDVKEIKAAAARAAALTRQLLAFSRKQVLQTRVLDLNAVVRGLETMLRRLLGEDVRLEVALGLDLGAVRADPGQIEQVVLNLAVNARDAMPEGGRLTLETANVSLDEEYARAHPGASAGPHVLLAVSDTGTGMDEATRSRLFEPFFTTKAVGKGTGLGLSTVYGIVKQSGGSIWVYSEPGRGATFKIYLPRVDAPVEEPLAVRAPAPVRGGHETVLLAEDDAGVRDVVASTLEQKGYRVLRASDGQVALELARALTDSIALLITDIVMPGRTGRELAETLGAERPGLKVLYLSGYTDDAVVRHGVLEAGVPFLQKPFTPAALAAKVRDLLDRP